MYFDHSAFCSDDDGEFESPLRSGRAPLNGSMGYIYEDYNTLDPSYCHLEAGFALYWASSVGVYTARLHTTSFLRRRPTFNLL